jgi:hypothetical protein
MYGSPASNLLAPPATSAPFSSKPGNFRLRFWRKFRKFRLTQVTPVALPPCTPLTPRPPSGHAAETYKGRAG